MTKTANRIRELRLEQELSQEQLAVYGGCTRITLDKLEKSDLTEMAATRIGTLRGIAGALDVSVVELIPALTNREVRRERRAPRSRRTK